MIPCKICGGDAPLHGVVDFNKSCEIGRGLVLPVLGLGIWYHRCTSCGFLFSRQFDEFKPEDWKREVYNSGYALVDPDYAGARAAANAPVARKIAEQLCLTDPLRASFIIDPPRGLDYGSGAGTLVGLLSDPLMEWVGWDPLEGDVRPAGLFELVTAFEVFEHTTSPIETCRDALGFVRGGGALLFSTLTIDELAPHDLAHWYIAPRNGHVSIHSTRSLELMFGQMGFHVQHLNPGLHVAMAN